MTAHSTHLSAFPVASFGSLCTLFQSPSQRRQLRSIASTITGNVHSNSNFRLCPEAAGKVCSKTDQAGAESGGESGCIRAEHTSNYSRPSVDEVGPDYGVTK